VGDREQERKGKQRDVYLVVLGVLLGVLSQALYDMLRNAYAQFFPALSPNWVDAIAAIVTVTAMWGLFAWKTRKN